MCQKDSNWGIKLYYILELWIIICLTLSKTVLNELNLSGFNIDSTGTGNKPSISTTCANASSCITWCDVTNSDSLTLYLRTNHKISHILVQSENMTVDMDFSIHRKFDKTDWLLIQVNTLFPDTKCFNICLT